MPWMVTAGVRRGGVARSLVCAIAVGAGLALLVLVAVSCQTSARIVPVDAATPDRAARAPLSMAPAENAAVRDEPLIRVRVRRGVDRAELDKPGPWVVAAAGARTGEVVSGPVRVLASSGGIQLRDASGRVTGFPVGVAVFAAPHTAADGSGTVRVDGGVYPGTLRLVPTDDPGAFDVVNVVEIEDYLPGVISKELVPGWHETAFRVQAVAARTYALERRERSRRSGRHFDVESTTADQVYGGSTGLDVAHSAVAATRGVVLIEGARLGTAYYSSTCGGRPAQAEEIWPPADARITTVALGSSDEAQGIGRDILCETAPLYRWEAVRRTEQLAERIEAWAAANRVLPMTTMNGLADIRATAHGHTGRPIRFAVIDRRGVSTEITAEQLRIACNFSADGLPSLTKTNRVYSNDLGFDVGRRTTKIEGQGFGHGVGMCQYCTQGMARRGDHWRDILTAFYPTSEIRRVF